MLPAIIEWASIAANCLPSLTIAIPSVASATDGAAQKSPAKLFGLKTSANTEKNETASPPIRNRTTISFMTPPLHNNLLQTALQEFQRLFGPTRLQDSKLLPSLLVVVHEKLFDFFQDVLFEVVEALDFRLVPPIRRTANQPAVPLTLPTFSLLAF